MLQHQRLLWSNRRVLRAWQLRSDVWYLQRHQLEHNADVEHLDVEVNAHVQQHTKLVTDDISIQYCDELLTRNELFQQSRQLNSRNDVNLQQHDEFVPNDVFLIKPYDKLLSHEFFIVQYDDE